MQSSSGNGLRGSVVATSDSTSPKKVSVVSRTREVPTGNFGLRVELGLFGVQPPPPKRGDGDDQRSEREESPDPPRFHGPEVTLVVPARVVEWQTRWTQNPLLARACGFKSRPGHPCPRVARATEHAVRVWLPGQRRQRISGGGGWSCPDRRMSSRRGGLAATARSRCRCGRAGR